MREFEHVKRWKVNRDSITVYSDTELYNSEKAVISEELRREYGKKMLFFRTV